MRRGSPTERRLEALEHKVDVSNSNFTVVYRWADMGDDDFAELRARAVEDYAPDPVKLIVVRFRRPGEADLHQTH